MTTETTTTTSGAAAEEKINQLRELFADAPEVGKKALENVLGQLTSQASQKPPPSVESAGRVGQPAGQGFGADHHRPLRARRSPAPARVPAVVRR